MPAAGIFIKNVKIYFKNPVGYGHLMRLQRIPILSVPSATRRVLVVPVRRTRAVPPWPSSSSPGL